MPTLITFVLIAVALAVLVGTLLSSRRHQDPSSSVEHFNRALAAMGSGGAKSDDDATTDSPTDS